MLDLRKVYQALTDKRHLLAGYTETQRTVLEGYRRELATVAALQQADIEARLQGHERPGARPSSEHDGHHQIVIPFAERWRNHEQARAWAARVLAGVPTLAVDGSQITPSRELSLPLGAVQIGWFENPHDAAGHYVKDVSFEILPPAELGDEGDDAGAGFPHLQVNWRRFQGECSRLVEYMRSQRGRSPRPVCFLDGSLIVSFAGQMAPKHQELYVGAIRELVETSATCRVPLVGYTDTSYAADLVAMLDTLAGRRNGPAVSDAALLHPLMHWGDRSLAWICARSDQLPPNAAGYYDQVVFLYLKTTTSNPPARLDVPRWLLEEGELEWVLDIVRAECVIGNGYPYAIETADAVAVITAQDRQRFYAAFQRFAAREGLPLHFSRKAGSKRGRR